MVTLLTCLESQALEVAGLLQLEHRLDALLHQGHEDGGLEKKVNIAEFYRGQHYGQG